MKKAIYTATILLAGLFVLIQLKHEILPGFSRTVLPAPNVVINGKIIRAEIADNFEAWRQGLSDRKTLDPEAGMLFVFPDKQIRNFWMKNMHFPLDIIWIDDDRVVNISANLPPEGETPAATYDSVIPVNYVLEVNAGLAERYNIKAGDSAVINR
jgi:uncharacterized protein